MPGLDFDAAIYVKSVPECRLEDGMVHICHKIGSASIEFVYRPNTFLKGLRAANRVADEFRAKGKIVGIKDHAASS